MTLAVLAVLLVLVLAENVDRTTRIIEAAVAVILLAGAIVERLRRRFPPATSDPDQGLSAALEKLAVTVRRQWEDEARERGLWGAEPIPVRWRWSERAVTGPVEAAVGDGPSHGRFLPLPGVPPADRGSVRAGGWQDLATLYGGLPSGRMVILGGPGTGKSAAAILALIDALGHRQSLDEDARRSVPVPVLLTAHGWDPRRERLDEWLAARLAADYQFLRSDAYGPDAALRLVEDRRVALFLDGFDEIPPSLRAAALRAIHKQATFRLVVLTRIEEFLDATSAGHLHGAAAWELQPLPAEEAADYLDRNQVRPLPPEWGKLTAFLRERPDSALAIALSSPLMLTLVRDTVADAAHQQDLLDPARFATPAEVEDYLLDRVLPAAYRPRSGAPSDRYGLDQAQRWLSSIAASLSDRGSRDLAWWRVHQWAPAAPRVVAMALVCGITTACSVGLAGAFALWLAGRPSIGALNGLLLGAAVGGIAGLASERRESRVPRSTRPQSGSLWDRLRSKFTRALRSEVGMGVGIGTGLTAGLTANGAFGLVAGVLTGVIVGVVSGLAIGLASAQRRAVPVRSTRDRWRSRFHPQVAVASGLPVGLATGLVSAMANGQIGIGLAYALGYGLLYGLAFGLLDGFLRPSRHGIVSVDPAGSWRRDQRRSLGFGLWFGLVIGLAAGFGDGLSAVSKDSGLVIGVAVGSANGLAVAIAVGVLAGLATSDAWRTTLAFVQLHFAGVVPWRGMRFLEDARRRGVLRTAGPVFQFRHARLQDRLARAAPSGRPGRQRWGAVRSLGRFPSRPMRRGRVRLRSQVLDRKQPSPPRPSGLAVSATL